MHGHSPPQARELVGKQGHGTRPFVSTGINSGLRSTLSRKHIQARRVEYGRFLWTGGGGSVPDAVVALQTFCVRCLLGVQRVHPEEGALPGMLLARRSTVTKMS